MLNFAKPGQLLSSLLSLSIGAGALCWSGCMLEEAPDSEGSSIYESGASERAQEQDNAVDSDTLADVFYNVVVAGDTIFKRTTGDDTPDFRYTPRALQTIDPTGKDISDQLEMYAPMECEKCTCSGGTCLCEGCSVLDL